MKRSDSILKIILTQGLFLLLITACSGQKISDSSKKAIEEVTNERIWIPSPQEESYGLKIKDTLKKEITLVFEQSFDDSVQILLNGKEIHYTKIKTDKHLSTVNGAFDINYNDEQQPIIEILLVEKNRKISFQPLKGYRNCYLTRLLNVWAIEFSNFSRTYE